MPYVLEGRLPRLLTESDVLGGTKVQRLGIRATRVDEGLQVGGARKSRAKVGTRIQWRTSTPQASMSTGIAKARQLFLDSKGAAKKPQVSEKAGGTAPTWSNRVAKRLQDVRMPPLGPRLYCFITFL